MTIRISTAARTKIMKNRSFRKIFEDGTLRLYTGSQPSSPDSGATGTLLATITKSAGTVTVKSERDVVITKVSTLGTTGNQYLIVVNGVSYTYTQLGGDTVNTVAKALAELVDADEEAECMAAGGSWVASTAIIIRNRFAGTSALVVSVSCTGTASLAAPSYWWSASTNNGLKFGSVVSGVITKNAETWTGSAVATGIAGWFRYSEFGDTPTSDTTSYARLDGSIAASGGDMTMGNTSLQTNAPVTIDTASFTEPIER